MGVHIKAKPGAYAETVLLPGDPLRARAMAEDFLDEVACCNEVRGMLGYTGLYQGKRVSIQATGMGMPSMSIYAHELVTEFGVKNLIRVGTCGSIHPELELGDIVLAQCASTNSAMNRTRFGGMDFAPCASFELLEPAAILVRKMGIGFKVGGVMTNDFFYSDDGEEWKLWQKYGVLALEMETSALYTIAAKNKTKALSILTVSDSLHTGKSLTPEQRQNAYQDSAAIALGLL